MVLGIGLSAARAGLQTTSEQLAIVSRNVSRMGDPSATRKIAQVTTNATGFVQVSEVVRAGTPGLVDALLSARSSASSEQVRSDALTKLANTLADPDSGRSPSVLLGKLQSALSLAAANPTDES